MPHTVTADAGYGSEQKYQLLEENFIQAFIKDPYFDKDQHDDSSKNPFTQEKIYYNEQKDCYYCPMGQPMVLLTARLPYNNRIIKKKLPVIA